MQAHDHEKTSLAARFHQLVRFEQTLFALPIALSSVVWAAGGWPGLRVLFWTVLAMVGGRTAGMSANRLIDARLDAANPRTADRLLPAGKVRPGTVLLLMLASLGLLAGAARQLNPLCYALCPVAFFWLLLYSYLKRFTWACHFGLGIVQACGTLGGWLAVTGRWEWPALALAVGVAFWMAGFDMLYALQDEEHDRVHGVHSVPARFGAVRACALSRLCHAVAFGSWCLFGWLMSAGPIFTVGLGVVGSLLIWEHVLVRPGRLDQLPLAFFKVNSMISTVLLIATLGEHSL